MNEPHRQFVPLGRGVLFISDADGRANAVRRRGGRGHAAPVIRPWRSTRGRDELGTRFRVGPSRATSFRARPAGRTATNLQLKDADSSDARRNIDYCRRVSVFHRRPTLLRAIHEPIV